MKSMIRFSGAALAVLLLPACATVTRGTKETYVIESTPSAATVTLSNGKTCVTPCSLKLNRKEEFVARFARDGYQPAEVQVESKIKAGGGVAAAGNLFIGGIIGAVVDGTNGSLMDLTPNPLRIQLISAAEAFRAPADPAPAVVAAPAAETQLPAPPAPAPKAIPAVALRAPPAPLRASAYVQPIVAADYRYERRSGESCANYAERLFPAKAELRNSAEEECERGS